MRPPISSSWKYSGNMRWNEMAQDEIWWVGFLASSADSSVANIGVSYVGFFFFYKQLSFPLFAVHPVWCCFYVHGPCRIMQSLCPLSTHTHAASVSTAHSVSCYFFVYCPVSLTLFLCPLATQSRAVSISTAHTVSCCFYVYSSLGLVLFLYPVSHHV